MPAPLSKQLLMVIHRARDLPTALETCVEGLKTQLGGRRAATVPDKAFELGELLEHCNPSLEHTVASYVMCWKADHERLDGLSRARYLSLEGGDFATAAKLAGLQYRQTKDVELLGSEGYSWLDAGQPDRAIKPLLAAVRLQPTNEAFLCGLRLAQREWPDVRAELASLMAQAESEKTRRAKGLGYLQVARLLRLLQTDHKKYEVALLASFEFASDDPHVRGLVDNRLTHLADEERLMEVLDVSLQACGDAPSLAAELKRIGMRLIRHERFEATGIRLIKRALDVAYGAQLSTIAGHVAMLTAYRSRSDAAGLDSQLLEMINKGLAQSLPELDLMFLALQGLDICWNRLDDSAAAATYASIAFELAPDHPLVAEAAAAGLVVEASEEPLDLGVAEHGVSRPETEGEAIFLDQVFESGAAPLDTSVGGSDVSANLAAAELHVEIEVDPPLDLQEPAQASSPDFFADLDPGDATDLEMAAEPLDLSAVGPEMLDRTPPPPPSPPPPPPRSPETLIPAQALKALKVASSERDKRRSQTIPERAFRLKIAIKASFELDGQIHLVTTRDLSVGGCFLITELRIENGTMLTLDMLLPKSLSSLQTTRVQVISRVVRQVDGRGYGLQFVKPDPSFVPRVEHLLEGQLDA